MSKLSYWELLRDPRWQEKRLRIMERAGFKCENCEDKTTTLNVHHTYYEKGVSPWEYPDHSLQCLCEPCHKLAEEYRKQLNRLTGHFQFGDLDVVIGFMKGWLLLNRVRDGFPINGATQLHGAMLPFAIDQQDWPSFMREAQEAVEGRDVVSGHDLECAAALARQDIAITAELLIVAEATP